jgi:hypothetical protein
MSVGEVASIFMVEARELGEFLCTRLIPWGLVLHLGL